MAAPETSRGDVAALNGRAFESVGDLLAARRRERAIELVQVEAATRVRVEYLDAIEMMDRRRLPDGPYAAGFVRSYAQYLGLNGAEVAARFRNEMAPRRETPISAPEPERRPIGPPPKWILGGVAATFAAGVFLWAGLSLRPPEPISAVQPVSDDARRWALEDPAQAVTVGLSLVAGPVISVRARLEIPVEVRAPSGRVIFAKAMARGEVYEIPPFAGLVVVTPNAGAVELLRDGVSLGRIGAPGVPASAWPVDSARQTPTPESALLRDETPTGQ